MTDSFKSVVLEQLRRLNGRFDRLELDLGDIKLRMSAVEDHLASVVMSVAGLNARLERVGRIERRPDLTEAH